MKKFLALLSLCGLLVSPLASMAASEVAIASDVSAVAVASAAASVVEPVAAVAASTPVAAVEASPVAEVAAAPAEAPKLDTGNTAWMLISTALVLFMTIPGLALFYGGMVRRKNILATLMQSFTIAAVATLVWVVIGYSLAFDSGNAMIGGVNKVLLKGISYDQLWPGYTIPEMLFIVFQMTFAIITPALITGAFAERMKFSSMIVFTVAWLIAVYSPICHWVWEAGGWLFTDGALDFAGGTVVHINAGIAGLVAAFVLGKRIGFGKEAMPPHNLVLTMIGASMLWVGWFGFNAGSWLAADGRAAMAMVVTQIAAAAAAVSWISAEWMLRGKPSVLGVASGAVAGLVVITPAAGFVGPAGAIAMGLIAGVVCFWGATSLKHMLKYDDSLDAFGVHGVGGILGALLVAVFYSSDITGVKDYDMMHQLWVQAKGVLATIAYSGVMTFIILKVIDLIMGLRVTEEEEREGLDVSLHGERVE